MDDNTIEAGTSGRILTLLSDGETVQYSPRSWLHNERYQFLDEILDGKYPYKDLNDLVKSRLFTDIDDAKEYINSNYSARPGAGYPLLIISHYVVGSKRTEQTCTDMADTLILGQWSPIVVCLFSFPSWTH
jgi:hypothetical protein